MRGRTVPRTWQYQPRLHAPAKYRRACRYDAFIPEPLLGADLSLTVGAAGIASEAEGAIRELNARARPALAPLARLLLRTESIASSRVEGLQMDLRRLARAEVRMETGGKVASTALEVIGNIDAMSLAIDAATTVDVFDHEQVAEIHRKLMERANPQIAGRFRTVQNWIGGNNPCGADFVPPPPEYVDGLIEDLCAYVNDETHPPLVQAALLHAQFETIHPFDDGNGRTGRALVHVVFRRRGVASGYVPPISVVLAAARDRYIAGLNRYRNGNIDSWIEDFSAAALRSAQLATEYLSAVQELTEDWRKRLAASPEAPRADAAAWAIIETLPAHPILTALGAAAATGRSKPQIYQGLSQLESAGVLLPLSHGRRNRSWEAAGLLDLLSGLEAGEAIRS